MERLTFTFVLKTRYLCDFVSHRIIFSNLLLAILIHYQVTSLDYISHTKSANVFPFDIQLIKISFEEYDWRWLRGCFPFTKRNSLCNRLLR